MGLIYKANGICYAGLQSWIYHIDEMKEYGLDNIPKFYSDLVVNSLEFKEKVSKNDRYFVFPKRKAFAEKNLKTPLEQIEDIEILRFIEMGYDVRMVELSGSSFAIDTPEDLQKVRDYLINYKEKI
jgi:hypothetical protein